MRAHFHRFLLLFLMLALPLQGIAAVAMPGCPAAHQDETRWPAVTGAAMADCHQPQSPDPTPAHADCVHCAACALAAALPLPAGDTLPMLPPSATRSPAAPAAAFTGFIPDTPERPPRAVLA